MDKPVSVKTREKAKAPARTEEQAWPTLTSLRDEVDRLFEDFMSGWPFRARPFAGDPWSRLPAAFRPSAPATDVAENDKAFTITVDLPGIDEKDIDVTLSDEVLTIRAETTREREEKKESYFLSERQQGSLQRAFQLPSGVNADKIEAKYDKGVLRLVLPKTPEAQKKQRKVRVQKA